MRTYQQKILLIIFSLTSELGNLPLFLFSLVNFFSDVNQPTASYNFVFSDIEKDLQCSFPLLRSKKCFIFVGDTWKIVGFRIFGNGDLHNTSKVIFILLANEIFQSNNVNWEGSVWIFGVNKLTSLRIFYFRKRFLLVNVQKNNFHFGAIFVLNLYFQILNTFG